MIGYIAKRCESFEIAMTPPESASVSICLCLLQRMLPFLFIDKELYRNFLWENDKQINKEPSTEAKKDKEETPYGIILIRSLIALLFKQNYCIEKIVDQDTKINTADIDPKIIWNNGVQCRNAKNNNNRLFDSNRVHVLSLILMCIGSRVYDTSITPCNYFGLYVTNTGFKNYKNLFLSLLNTVISYDWKGYGIPYISSKPSKYDEVADLSLQLLYALIEYVPFSLDQADHLLSEDHIVEIISKNVRGDSTYFITNEYSRFICTITDQNDYHDLFKGITELFSNFITFNNTTLPSSVKKLDCFNELLTFLLRLIVLNPVLYI